MCSTVLDNSMSAAVCVCVLGRRHGKPSEVQEYLCASLLLPFVARLRYVAACTAYTVTV